MKNDILYSFRRCPYAIRVRWALLICDIKVEIREIDLKNKPLDFLNKSKTKTVPILITKIVKLLKKVLKSYYGHSQIQKRKTLKISIFLIIRRKIFLK